MLDGVGEFVFEDLHADDFVDIFRNEWELDDYVDVGPLLRILMKQAL